MILEFISVARARILSTKVIRVRELLLSLLMIRLLLLKVKLSLSTTSYGRAASNLHHRSLDNFIDLASNMLDFVLTVQISLHYFISFNKSIEFALKLIILLSQQSLMTVE
jgi:hypothetical protein